MAKPTQTLRCIVLHCDYVRLDSMIQQLQFIACEFCCGFVSYVFIMSTQLSVSVCCVNCNVTVTGIETSTLVMNAFVFSNLQALSPCRAQPMYNHLRIFQPSLSKHYFMRPLWLFRWGFMSSAVQWGQDWQDKTSKIMKSWREACGQTSDVWERKEY